MQPFNSGITGRPQFIGRPQPGVGIGQPSGPIGSPMPAGPGVGARPLMPVGARPGGLPVPIRSFKKGGTARKSGVYRLHRGERVVRRGRKMPLPKLFGGSV